VRQIGLLSKTEQEMWKGGGGKEDRKENGLNLRG